MAKQLTPATPEISEPPFPDLTPHVLFDESTLVSEILDLLANTHGVVPKLDERIAKLLASYHRRHFEINHYLDQINPLRYMDLYKELSRSSNQTMSMILKIRADLKLDARQRRPQGAIADDFGALFQEAARNKSTSRRNPTKQSVII